MNDLEKIMGRLGVRGSLFKSLSIRRGVWRAHKNTLQNKNRSRGLYIRYYSVIIATLALSFAFMLNSPSAKAALPAPGGVDTGLELWLKADAATVVGSGITNWDDSTGQHSDEQIINGPIPYTVSAYNFNPTARFQNKYMRWLSQQLLSGATAGENFFVLRTLALPGQHSGYPSEF